MRIPLIAGGLLITIALGCNGLLGINQLEGEPERDGGRTDEASTAPATEEASTADASGDASADAPDASFDGGVQDAADACGLTCDGPISPQCYPRPSGLVSWWRGEGNSADSVGSNNGTATNVTYVEGMVGQAFHFAGNGYVMADAIGLPSGSGDRTTEMWVRIASSYAGPNADYSEGNLFGYGGWNVAGGVYDLVVAGGGGTYLPQDSLVFSQWGAQVASPRALTEGEWHHVAATLASGVLTVYLDGESAVSETGAPSIETGTGGTVYIGGIPITSAWLEGDVDEASVYARALGAAEISGIVAAQAFGKCP